MEVQIEGRIPVLEALKADRAIKQILLAKGSKGKIIEDIERLSSSKGIPCKWVTKQIIEERASTRGHQGIIATAQQRDYVSLEETVLEIDLEEKPIILMLDHLQDPQNFGAIIRTAETAGVKVIIIPKNRSVGLSPVVARVSAGAVEYLPIAQVNNLAQAIDWLKEQGYWIVGAEAAAGTTVYRTDLVMPMVMVIGSEGKGLSRLVKEKCDFLINLPLRGEVNSLNASTASAALLFEAVRQRLEKQE